jgi:hypothetical protein
LVEYEIDGNDILSPRKKTIRKDLRDEQDDSVLQQEVWELFAAIIPVDNRELKIDYVAITDGLGSRRAVLRQDEDYAIKWNLNTIPSPLMAVKIEI